MFGGFFNPIREITGGIAGAAEDVVSGVKDVAKDVLSNPIAQVALTYYAPGFGEMIAADLGVSQAVGTAIAKVGIQTASGVPLETAILNAGVDAGVSAGVKDISPEVRKAFTDNPGLADAVTSAGASAVSTAAKGGSGDDTLKAAIAGAAGSSVTTATGDKVLGAAATGYATGGVQGAATAASGALGTEAAAADKAAKSNVSSADQQIIDAFAKASSTQNLSSLIDSANLTPDESAFLKEAQQQVYNQSLTAQALPITTTDAGAGASTRLGTPFAANDPRFISALQKNPDLIKGFSEYTNTYGAKSPAMDAAYKPLIEEALKQNPTDKNLLEEYKNVTGQDYVAPEGNVSDMGTIEITAPRETNNPNIVVASGTQFKPGTAPETGSLTGTTPTTAAGQNAQAGLGARPNDSAALDYILSNLQNPAAVAAYAGSNRFSTGDLARIAGVDEGVVKTYLGDNKIESSTPASETPTETPTEDTSSGDDFMGGGDGGGPSEPPPKKDETNITVTSYKTPPQPLAAPSTITSLGSSPLQQALTAYRPAGEIEDVSTGKKRENVWNESSLRLKDALGI